MYLLLTQVAYITAPFLVFVFVFNLLSAIESIVNKGEAKDIKFNGILASISLLVLLSPLFYLLNYF
jgi:hypothetical protein